MSQVESLPGKIAVLSHALPPDMSGQALMLERLFRNVDPTRYCLISNSGGVGGYAGSGVGRSLPARCIKLRREYQLGRPNRFGTRAVREMINHSVGVAFRGWQIAAAVRREGCSAIMACTGDLYNIPAAYLASRLAGVPFIAYIFDDYVFQWPPGPNRDFARRVEPRIVGGAAAVIVPNEFARDEYLRRYGKAPTIIRNPHDIGHERAEPSGWPTKPGEVRVVYTGSVYHAHYDAFVNLARAIAQLGRAGVALHIHTAQPRDVLENQGITGPVSFHPSLPPEQISVVQQEADILFLALAFDSTIPEVIKSSAPGKIGEYLASGRPILVLAPSDSYLSWYFTQNDCGVVVNDLDPATLAAALRRILDDPELRLRITTRARACAKTFERATIERDFLTVIRATMSTRPT